MARKINVKRTEKVNRIPVEVEIISVVYYIAAVVYVLLGLLMVFGSSAVASSVISSYPNLGLETIGQGALVTMMVVMGILIVGFGVLLFFVAKGIWKLRKWAKIVVIVLSILGIFSAVFSMIRIFALTHIVMIVIHGIIAGYLLFNEEAKRIFK